MTTTTNVKQVKLNVMTQNQYNSATKNANELYMVTDAQINYNDLSNKPTVDQTYDGTSANAQSGVAVASALSGYVPTSRTVNGKALSSNISLSASDVGALPSSTVIPTVNNATLTIQTNSSNVATFTANASSNVTANISVPTKMSDLTNDRGYITGITSSDVTSALGYTPYNSSNPSGYQANVIEIVKVNGTALTPSNKAVDVSVPTVTSIYTASGTDAVNGVAVSNAIATKQDNLVSGTNIKTINGTSLLGSGNITIETSSTPNVDGETISYNSNDVLQTIAVKNVRDNSTLPIWQGTEQQWNQGEATPWYYWQTSVAPICTNVTYPDSSYNFMYIAYGNGTFVGIGDSSKVAYSSDNGQTWTTSSYSTSVFYRITFNDGKFVSAGSSGIAYSSDNGQTWTTASYNLGKSLSISDQDVYVAYGNGKIVVVVSQKNNGAAYVNSMCSSDLGQTWTEGNLDKSIQSWSSVIWSEEEQLFFALSGLYWASSSTWKFAYSSDGINWSYASSYPSTYCWQLAYYHGRIFTLPNANNKSTIYYSDDLGETWKSSTLPYSTTWVGICCSNDTIFLTNYYGKDYAAYSTDGGNTWQSISLPQAGYYSSIAYGNNMFLTFNQNPKNTVKFSISYDKCYTDTANPTTSSTVYSAPAVTSSYTISSVTSGAITLSNNNTYYYNQSGNTYTYQTVGEAHPNYLCFINGVGVKIGNTTIATA